MRAASACLCGCLAVGAACGNGGVGTDAAADAPLDTQPTGSPVTLRFAAMVGAQPFSCTQTYHQLGTTLTDWRPADFRLYVHNVRLLSAAGVETPVHLDEDGLWQHADVGLLDFEDQTGGCSAGTAATNGTLTGRVAPGSYVGIRFNLGVPFDLDHADVSVAPSPLNVTGLYWSWEGGYMFVRIDGATTGQPLGYSIHLGSTGCVADATGRVLSACASPNVPEISLPAFDPTTQTIVADLALLTSATDLDTNTASTAPGCLADADDPDCASVFAHFNLPFGGVPSPGQAFFRVQ